MQQVERTPTLWLSKAWSFTSRGASAAPAAPRHMVKEEEVSVLRFVLRAELSHAQSRASSLDLQVL